MVEKSRAKKSPPKKRPEVRHPAFAAVLNKWMADGNLNNGEVGRELRIGAENVRRYREGWVMPRKDKLAKLAAMMGMSPRELEYPLEAKETMLAGMLGEGVELSPDEQQLLKAYRKMKAPGRKMIRAYAVRLLEDMGIKGADNPFGKANTQ